MTKNKQTVIILGSSRSRGDTYQLSKYLIKKAQFDLIDLNEYNFSYYDYDHQNRTDDFLPLMKSLIQNYETFLFATPVYWYTMSGIMKVFFDRMSDLLTIEKDLGRKLRGKNMALLSCSDEDDLPEHFNMPFVNTAEYLGMNWLGESHGWIENEGFPQIVKERLDRLLKKWS